METKSFLFSQKKNKSVLLVFLILNACSSLKTRTEIRHTQPAQKSVGSTSFQISNPTQTTPPLVEEIKSEQNASPEVVPSLPVQQIPKIGLILGPGGALTYAHIGFLHEMQKQKVPIHSVAGVEFAAPMAALFSLKGFANDVEWQMFKLKEDEVIKKSIIGGEAKTNDIRSVSEFLKTAFGQAKAEDGRLPFACPALNLVKKQTFVMARGSFEQLLPYCMAYPPLFKTYNLNVSGIRDVKQTADYLRSQGANYIVLVNVLGSQSDVRAFAGDSDSAASIYWNEISAFYAKPIVGIDHIVTLQINSYGLLSFDKRREIMQKGSEQSVKALEILTHKIGL